MRNMRAILFAPTMRCADPACGFGFGGPDRFKQLMTRANVDGGYWQFAQQRRNVGRQRRFPLFGMFQIAPAGTMGSYVGRCALIEGHRLRQNRLRFLRRLRFERVEGMLAQPPRLDGTLTGLGKPYAIERA